LLRAPEKFSRLPLPCLCTERRPPQEPAKNSWRKTSSSSAARDGPSDGHRTSAQVTGSERVTQGSAAEDRLVTEEVVHRLTRLRDRP
jgi:hypothetical protein